MIVITGANGHLGRRLLAALTEAGRPARAIVRSARAARQITDLGLQPAPEIREIDYLDSAAMRDALTGCTRLVHLVGIIKEGAAASYMDAHERTAEVVAQAAADAGLEQIVYLSIVGTSVASPNACLASKAAAERLLTDGSVPAVVLRVPMVLGEGDYASAALRQRAQRGVNVLLRGGSLEQPIYAGDVIAAVLAALEMPDPASMTLDLAGPRSLTRTALTRAAAAARGADTTVISLPVFLGMLAAWVLERTSGNPPVTRAMLGVLDHDDAIDPGPAAQILGISLTDLETTLARCVGDAGPT